MTRTGMAPRRSWSAPPSAGAQPPPGGTVHWLEVAADGTITSARTLHWEVITADGCGSAPAWVGLFAAALALFRGDDATPWGELPVAPRSMAAAGDLDQDGYADLIIGLTDERQVWTGGP